MSQSLFASRVLEGRICLTPEVDRALEIEQIDDLLGRYIGGDYGDVSQIQEANNVQAVFEGSKVEGRYDVGGQPIRVVTDAGWSDTAASAVTTFMPQAGHGGCGPG